MVGECSGWASKTHGSELGSREELVLNFCVGPDHLEWCWWFQSFFVFTLWYLIFFTNIFTNIFGTTFTTRLDSVKHLMAVDHVISSGCSELWRRVLCWRVCWRWHIHGRPGGCQSCWRSGPWATSACDVSPTFSEFRTSNWFTVSRGRSTEWLIGDSQWTDNIWPPMISIDFLGTPIVIGQFGNPIIGLTSRADLQSAELILIGNPATLCGQHFRSTWPAWVVRAYNRWMRWLESFLVMACFGITATKTFCLNKLRPFKMEPTQ